ncbi:AAA domain-containing protein [Tistlia consotensis]|uniref:AAA domain-containing protein n=2 Tax=Tistlia TaxID=1321364 RepID=A0A1Y6CB63_9PROT|nr:AAA domain-containing protein [Tistlia consotensis USBA 355]SNR42962.1 AAA domain-containing protein [Tistlia consotensis]
MKSVAFFNNKGGVGKTTLLCNIASYMATELGKRVLVIDADPQCNATQYMFDDKFLEYLYEETSSFTIYNVIRPLAQGKGYSKDIKLHHSPHFHVDVIAGDPRLALTEDLLARDWGAATAGDVRGIRTSVLFVELLNRYHHYDVVFFDVGPSLGSINRAVLLGSDYFISPMATDIFSLKAIENIAEWFSEWTKKWKSGLQNSDAEPGDIPVQIPETVTFAGYVTQQYLAKKDSTGTRRAVNAYDRIISQVGSVVQKNFSDSIKLIPNVTDYNIGTIPNLFSLIPMSQTRRKPIFGLASADGIRGAHFAKVRDAKEIFGRVARKLDKNISL